MKILLLILLLIPFIGFVSCGDNSKVNELQNEIELIKQRLGNLEQGQKKDSKIDEEVLIDNSENKENIEANTAETKMIEELKKKYKHMQAKFTSSQCPDRYLYTFEDSNGNEHWFFHFEDDAPEYIDFWGNCETNPKYKGKTFDIFYMDEEREINSEGETWMANESVIYKLIIKE